MTNETLNFASSDYLKGFLSDFLDVSKWGAGGAKTVADLFSELSSGDCGLVQEQNGILRLTWPIFVNVLYKNKGFTYELYEARQEFKDGRTRSRNLPGSIGEKRNLRQDIFSAAHRAIQEELKPVIPLSLSNSNLEYRNEWQEMENARSYPNLLTRSENTLFSLTLSPDQGEPKPFVLVEPKKKSFFAWKIA